MRRSAFQLNNGLRPSSRKTESPSWRSIPRDTLCRKWGRHPVRDQTLVQVIRLLIADQTFLFKAYLLHEVALKHGLIAVCMAKAAGRGAGMLDAYSPEHRRSGTEA